MPAFLHPWLLAGLAAASIPIIIHLFHRRKFVRIDWGAMRFLEELLVHRIRRRRIEEWLLLAARVLLLALLALAIARPYLTGALSGILGGAAHRDVAVIIDGSDSMSRAAPDGGTYLDRARQAAAALLANLSTGDGVSLILATEVARPVYAELSYDPKRWLEDLAGLESPGGGIAVPRALETALTLLADGRNPFREVIIITDAARAGWSIAGDAEWAFVSAALDRIAVRPPIRVLSVADPDPSLANLAVVDLEPSRSVVGTDFELGVYATVANLGPEPARGYAVRFALDGATLEVQPAGDLDPGKRARVRSLVAFPKHGTHIVEASVSPAGAPIEDPRGAVGPGDPGDAIRADSVRRLAIDVLESFPVLLVDGDPSLEPFRSETEFLRAALAPSAARGADPGARSKALIVPTVIPADRVKADDLAGNEVIILANVPKLPEDVRDTLELLVAGGGGLVIFAGDKIDRDWYRDKLFRGGSGPLPAEIGETASAQEGQFFAIPEARRADEWPFLSDATEVDVREIRIQSVARLDVPEDATGVRVLLRLADGEPLIVEKRFGAGVVLLVSVPPDADWSNFPAHHVFVVLAHHLVYYASRGRSLARNLAVGEPILVGFQRRPDAVTVVPPAGDPAPAEIRLTQGQALAEYAMTERPGVYDVSATPSLPAPVRFAVERSPDEADLAPLAAPDREAVAGRAGLSFIDDPETFLQGYGARDRQTDLWLACMLGAIGMLLAETFLTRRLAARRTGAGAAPDFEAAATRGAPRRLA
ncbi:MAG: BatA domain-containing protein [Planctomycetes bacterium]|nr:BatA domain-containing protein [Planctomycetota bacterium]